jgi:hypothetical protein
VPVLTSVEQPAIRVDVDFYDADERRKLLQYPTAAAIDALVSRPVDVPTAEFLTYYLFHKKRLGSPLYSNYRSIGTRIASALAALDGCIAFNGHSVGRAEGSGGQINEVSEHVGEAIGLSIVGRIHGLTDADWEPIPTQSGRRGKPTFDYQIASDGHRFVEVENKGSSVDDNRTIGPSVSAQKRRIDEKKQKLTGSPTDASAVPASPLRYGTIVVADARRDGNIRCWLTDPTPEDLMADPRLFRVLARMRFLWEWVSFISVRSQLASALATRLADLESVSDAFELANVPLRRGTGEMFDLSGFFNNKSRVADLNAGGLIVRLSSEALFFVGIRAELLSLVSEQDFDATAGYRAEVETADRAVECRVNKDTFAAWELGGAVEAGQERGGPNVVFRLRGQIHAAPSGLVFGVLPLPRGSNAVPSPHGPRRGIEF